jgi:NAD(P)-dependent dehydrogenase (short-subunit alcohol dehydrogenase family)
MDVTDQNSVNNAFKEVSRHVQSLEVLINNAGIIGPESFFSSNTDEFLQILNTNFLGCIRTSQVFFSLLNASSEARIINISSGMGSRRDLEQGGYAAYRLSKANLNSLSILMAADGAGHGIKVFSMCPGWVRTDMGGSSASRDVSTGAETAVWLSTTELAETGSFYRDKKQIPW